jgi:signal transduction protein with GAF and PtsI domain
MSRRRSGAHIRHAPNASRTVDTPRHVWSSPTWTRYHRNGLIQRTGSRAEGQVRRSAHRHGEPAAEAAATLVDGQNLLVDGGEGTIVVEPDPGAVQQALADEHSQRAALAASSEAGRTADGHGVQLLVNIAGDKDLAAAAGADTEGVGLFPSG